MLPDRPRLRPLEAFPIDDPASGERRLALRDPSGMADGVAVLPPAAAAVVSLCDGTRDLAALQAEIARRYRERISLSIISGLLEQLDEGLFLDSPRFAGHRERLLAEFSALSVRPASHAGASYPAERAALIAFLDGFFEGAAGPGVAPRQRRGGTLRALIAPHIDFQRGGVMYARSYLPLHDLPEPPELVVVFGTDHNGVDEPFTLTRKSYDTPLGVVETDVELVDRLARRLAGRESGPALFADELHHRSEHSIEFQAVALRHAWPTADLRVLPILVGSFHRFIADGGHADPTCDRAIARFLETLGELLAGRRTLLLAGADLAHVGPRFGDPSPLTASDREALASADAASLAACAAGDALGFFRSVAREGDARRVCGLSPIYSLLHLLGPARGEVVGYDQCAVDESGGSLVSIAGVVYR